MSAQSLPDDQTPSGSPATASLHRLTLPGPMLQRGFWLYVWRVLTPKGERLYVGRTGDSSSPHATAPYTRMGQHLGFSKAQNSLRRLLTEAGVEPESCKQFELISYGPIFPEIGFTKDQLRPIRWCCTRRCGTRWPGWKRSCGMRWWQRVTQCLTWSTARSPTMPPSGMRCVWPSPNTFQV